MNELSSKQIFDLKFKYNNFGYKSSEKIPFMSSSYFYTKNCNFLLTTEFLNEFINVINLYFYLNMIYNQYEIYTRYEPSLTSLLDIILEYDDVDLYIAKFIMHHFKLKIEFIDTHYLVIDKFADEILNSAIYKKYHKNVFYSKEAKNFFKTNTPTELNYLKWNLLQYYKLRGEDDSNERAFREANLRFKIQVSL